MFVATEMENDNLILENCIKILAEGNKDAMGLYKDDLYDSTFD